MFFCSLQYLLPAIVHINHQPYLERGDGPIVSANSIFDILLDRSVLFKSSYPSVGIQSVCKTLLIPPHPLFTVSGARPNQRAGSAGTTGRI